MSNEKCSECDKEATVELNMCMAHYMEMHREYERLKKTLKQNQAMREALGKYANPENWDSVNYPNMFLPNEDLYESIKGYDCVGGEIARKVLEAIK